MLNARHNAYHVMQMQERVWVLYTSQIHEQRMIASDLNEISHSQKGKS